MASLGIKKFILSGMIPFKVAQILIYHIKGEKLIRKGKLHFKEGLKRRQKPWDGKVKSTKK